MEGPISPANRPYPPPSNVIAVIQRLRSRNLPERTDVEYLRDAGVPEGSIGRVAFALRFLGVVEDDAPTPALRAIATSTDEEYRAILAGLIRDAYSEVFEVVDPATDSQDRIVNFFRRYSPASQRARMVIFFLGMCREAGIPTLDVPRQRMSSVSSGPKQARSSARPARRPSATPSGPAPIPRPQDPSSPRLQPATLASSLLFGVSEEDIGLLEEDDFDEVWTALGKIARARARAQRQRVAEVAPLSAPSDNETDNPDK